MILIIDLLHCLLGQVGNKQTVCQLGCQQYATLGFNDGGALAQCQLQCTSNYINGIHYGCQQGCTILCGEYSSTRNFCCQPSLMRFPVRFSTKKTLVKGQSTGSRPRMVEGKTSLWILHPSHKAVHSCNPLNQHPACYLSPKVSR